MVEEGWRTLDEHTKLLDPGVTFFANAEYFFSDRIGRTGFFFVILSCVGGSEGPAMGAVCVLGSFCSPRC